MEKRYQVFVSSTYEDLREERQEVMQALLELDCIPSGMELFPAADEDQWTLIKKVIDDCDYYMVIVGGRYGSVGNDGKSYTQMEYEYAVSTGKPVIGFVHSNPGKISAEKTEKTDEGRKKPEEFRNLARAKMCKGWSSAKELGSVVSRSVIQLIKAHPAVGWVRGDVVTDEESSKEILTLRRNLEELRGRLDQSRTQAPAGTENLAQGEDRIVLSFEYLLINKIAMDSSGAFDLEFSWNEILSVSLPLMIGRATEGELRKPLNDLGKRMIPKILKKARIDESDISHITVKLRASDFQTVKVQLRALGLIAEDDSRRSIRDKNTYWRLTPYGDSIMTRLKAVRKPSSPAKR